MQDIDNSALIGYPIFLTIALISATITITFLYINIENLHRNLDIREVEEQLSLIVSKAETMDIYDSNNTIQTLNINLPDTLYIAVLGGIPSDTGEPIISNETCNQYYYIMKDGTIKIYHSKVSFTFGESNKDVILTPGRHTITLKLYEKNGRSYVTVYRKQ
ncbi:MAG: hypothetical protein DRN12_02685 [Thermoplasmata archaeon]|nr:MAG: hypothetical protein DRN12_02685 [Thermoplasmata archaeon]